MSKWFEAEEFIVTKDIITITESKLDSSISDTAINPHSFFINRCDRNCHGGGVITYVHPGFKPVALTSNQSKFAALGLEVTITKIALNQESFIVLGVYRPPNSKCIWFELFRDLIMEMSSVGKFIIMGDLNCDLLRPQLSTTNNLLMILELANSSVQANPLMPTRITDDCSSCIDLIAVDRSLEVSSYSVSDFLASDHHPVVASILVLNHSSLSPIIKRSFKDVDFVDLGSRLADIQLHAIDDAAQLDEQLAVWHSNVIASLDEFAPIRKYPRCNKTSWINHDTRGLQRHRSALSRKLRNDKADNGNTSNIDHIKSLSRQIKSRIRGTLKKQASDALSNHKSKEAWKFIKKATFSQRKGSSFSYLTDISKVNNFFGDLVKADSSISLLSSTVIAPGISALGENSSVDKFSICPLDIYATARLLQQVKSDSAMGPDEIPAFMLKKLAPYLAPNVMHLFNSSIATGAFPTEWKKANVSVVYKKKGSKTEVENYRPISILPVLGRLLEKAVASQLQLYCDVNNIIPVQQFGFRKNSSCELALLAALDNWQHDVSEGKLVGTLLIDLSKAFDSVSHPQLINELSSIGCSLHSLDWFISYLTSRVQRVKLDKVTSPWKPVSKGVPQGSSLSPLLFNIFVRQLPLACEGDVYQFADDLTNSVSDSNPEALCVKLQASYAKVKSFCDNKNLHINLSKTQLVVFKTARKQLPSGFSITLDDKAIIPSSTVLLLGVTIDQHFTMAAHIDLVVKKCHGLLGMLRRAASYLPPALLTLAYTSLIRSYLEYNSATFATAAPTHLKKLDVIQKIASRIITNSPSQTHSAPLQIMLGLDALDLRRTNHVVNLVEKIVSGRTHPYFVDYFNPSSRSNISTTSVSFNRNLDNKRFSRFGLRMFKDKAENSCTIIRALELVLGGRSLVQGTSQTSSTVISSVTTTTDLSTAAVAQSSHRA